MLKNFRDGVYSKEAMREKFKLFVNKENKIKNEVLRYLTTTIGEKLTDQQFQDFITEVDPGKTGMTDFDRLSDVLLN